MVAELLKKASPSTSCKRKMLLSLVYSLPIGEFLFCLKEIFAQVFPVLSRIPFLNQIWLPVSERHEGAFWIKMVCFLMPLNSLHIRHIHSVPKCKEN